MWVKRLKVSFLVVIISFIDWFCLNLGITFTAVQCFEKKEFYAIVNLELQVSNQNSTGGACLLVMDPCNFIVL